MRFSLRRLLIFTALIAFAIWFFRSVYIGLTQIETAESVASVDWLPDSATNVSYYRSYLNTAYEFDIDESEFRKWSRCDITEITEPVQLSRYLAFSTPRPQEPVNPTEEERIASTSENYERVITIRNGLYYGHTQRNGGGVWVAYDRQTGRAYFRSAPR